MKCADIMQSIEYVRSALKEWIQADLVFATQNEVSWFNYKPGIFRDVYYPLEYQWLLDNRQYSFLLCDGSFLQFYYAFDKEGLYSARAALYPKPLSIKVSDDELLNAAESAQEMEEQELSDYLLNLVEEMEKKSLYPSNTSHVRFDFDRKVQSHSKSHIQFGGLNELRVEADFVPQPYAFIEVIGSAFQGIDFPHDAAAQAHSKNKALREVARSCLIHLAHT